MTVAQDISNFIPSLEAFFPERVFSQPPPVEVLSKRDVSIPYKKQTKNIPTAFKPPRQTYSAHTYKIVVKDIHITFRDR